MKYSFRAIIYKVGINPCVDVPEKIYKKLNPVRGYIPIEGVINQFPFYQTLVPVKNSPYRLYVNGPMMKGAIVNLGEEAKFSIWQNMNPEKLEVAMPQALKVRLLKENLVDAFSSYTPSRQKEIIKYLSYLKTEESILRNIEKVIAALKK